MSSLLAENCVVHCEMRHNFLPIKKKPAACDTFNHIYAIRSGHWPLAVVVGCGIWYCGIYRIQIFLPNNCIPHFKKFYHITAYHKLLWALAFLWYFKTFQSILKAFQSSLGILKAFQSSLDILKAFQIFLTVLGVCDTTAYRNHQFFKF